jgi:hypothetical protein
MSQADDPCRAIIAQWVFEFIRSDLRIGYDLITIKNRLNRALASGKLDAHLNAFKLVQGMPDKITPNKKQQ